VFNLLKYLLVLLVLVLQSCGESSPTDPPENLVVTRGNTTVSLTQIKHYTYQITKIISLYVVKKNDYSTCYTRINIFINFFPCFLKQSMIAKQVKSKCLIVIRIYAKALAI
jgi:hypothetical protein